MSRTLLAVFLLFSALAVADCNTPTATSPHATVVVFRPKLFHGSGIRAGIHLDDQMVCNLSNGHYAILEVVAGEHTLRGPDKKRGGVIQDFKAGVVYYYRALPTDGFTLNTVPQAEAAFDLKSLKPQDGETKQLPKVATP